jgi:Dyp-type peroxidase family
MATARHLPPTEPILDGDQIQGNAVPGFMKPHMAVAALAIDDVAKAKTWCGDVAPTVTTLAQANVSHEKVREHRGLGPERAEEARLGTVPDDVDDAWTNLGVSCAGLTKLLGGGAFAGDVGAFADDGFQNGLAARSALLGDPTDPTAEGNPANWVVGGPENAADVVVVVAADRAKRCSELLREVLAHATGSGLSLVYEQHGNKLDRIGKEHFGFQDGVSQPGVRGRLSEASDSFVTPREIDPEDVPDAWLYGLPGQYLVWPGEFVFGYPKSGADPLTPGQVNLPGPSWSRNGSYLVYRRLRQDVAAFWRFVTAYAEGLATRPGFEGITPDWLAARIVGRWPSGAPVSRLPDHDERALGVDRLANNNFGYAAPAEAVPLKDGGTSNHWPEAAADPVGLTCPMAAHIRKVNARETPNDLGGRRASFSRRILRRGLPYGKRLEDPLGPDPENGNRGLLFVSYQASIADQFEFLCTSWMGSPTNPRSPSGFDMLIGQNGSPGGNRVRSSVVFGANGAQATLSTLLPPDALSAVDFVIPTGGGYFFSPSIDALKNVLGR